MVLPPLEVTPDEQELLCILRALSLLPDRCNRRVMPPFVPPTVPPPTPVRVSLLLPLPEPVTLTTLGGRSASAAMVSAISFAASLSGPAC